MVRSKKSVEDSVAEFVRARPLYEGFSLRAQDLLRDILGSAGLKHQLVEGRVKSAESFREKIVRPGKSYKNPVEELSDLCGCRIITYYADDVAKVVNLLKSEFSVVEEEASHEQGSP